MLVCHWHEHRRRNLSMRSKHTPARAIVFPIVFNSESYCRNKHHSVDIELHSQRAAGYSMSIASPKRRTCTALYCLTICTKNKFPPGEGRHHHDQRRLWKVEVRDHCVDGTEGISGIYEYVSPSIARMIMPFGSATVSSVRTVVVPTATIRPPTLLALLIASAASVDTW